jgi:hypothetical protein
MQDFFISSVIELRCNQTSRTHVRWTLANCTSASCLTLHPQQIDPAIHTSFAELSVPARTLPFGLYELRLHVTMNISGNITASQAAYVRITPSGFTANLVQLGTSMITSGVRQNLRLNPGLYSVDRDGFPFNASVGLRCTPSFVRVASLVVIRIGATHTIVDCMIEVNFHISMAYCSPSMIHGWICQIHHVSIIDLDFDLTAWA